MYVQSGTEEENYFARCAMAQLSFPPLRFRIRTLSLDVHVLVAVSWRAASLRRCHERWR